MSVILKLDGREVKLQSCPASWYVKGRRWGGIFRVVVGDRKAKSKISSPFFDRHDLPLNMQLKNE